MSLRRYFRGRARPGEMNRLEAEYAAYLRGLQHAGEVLWWAFEPIKLKLARLTTYTPDFVVMRKDGTLECHETKGMWTDSARVKTKVAAEKFPFRFIAIKKTRGEWETEEL